LESPVEPSIALARQAQEIREMWQAKVLGAATGRMLVAVTSMLAHTYDEAMPVLLRVVEPRCWDASRQSLRTPFLCSIAKINHSGRIVADAVMGDYQLPQRDTVIFVNEADLQRECRILADKVKLNDQERVEFFKVAKRWVAADRRLDPAMNPQDPDAKRLVH
jgi:hypothetical protein